MEANAVEPVQTDTQTDEQSGLGQSTKTEMTESEKIAKIIADKDKGYEKMKKRMDSEVEGLKSKLTEYEEKLKSFEVQKTEANKPVRPTMPSNFNMDDVVDSESASAKYLRELTAYEKAIEQSKLDEALSITKQLKSQYEQTQSQLQQTREIEAQFNQAVQGIVDEGETESRAREIAQYFFKPESKEPKALIKYYNAIMPPNRGLEIEKRAERGKIPTPASLGGGDHHDTLTDADKAEAESMNVSLETFAYLKRKRIEREKRKK